MIGRYGKKTKTLAKKSEEKKKIVIPQSCDSHVT